MDRTAVYNFLNDNRDTAVDIAVEITRYDGSLSEFDIIGFDDFTDCYDSDPKKLAEILLNSLDNISSGVEYIRFCTRDEIEEVTYDQLQDEVVDYLDEIVDGLERLYPAYIDIYDDSLLEFLDDEEEGDEEE